MSRTRSSSQDIQETKNAPITTNASKPRSMAWHDRRAALQATPMSTQSLRLPLNHAAQQRAMPYQTSIQTRPTRDRKLEPKAASATLGLRSTQKSYVQHKTYDTAAAAALPPKQRLKMGPPLPPKPAPLPENFEGLKGEEQISLSKRAFRVHCQDCGSELERSSERLGGSMYVS